jgi:2-oxoisovalerate dehydrogenase E2 component (dihydrolipoyl transacylase)
LTIQSITMPQLGESVTEGTLSKWLVSIGDHVNKYDPIAEVMTDKVNAEIPSSFSGKIKELIAKEGDTFSVGEVICTIEVNDDDEISPSRPGQASEKSAAIAKTAGKVALRLAGGELGSETTKIRYSPAVLKLSQEHCIDLTQVKGTGAGGRVTRKDVLKLIEMKKESAEAKPTQAANTPQTAEPAPQKKPEAAPQAQRASQIATSTNASGDIEIPVTGVRKVIAANMVRSKQEVPHAWMMVEADVTNLVAYRNELKDEFKKKEGFNLTYFAFFVKAVAQALKAFPEMNSMWAGDKIIQKKDINISIAVATETALFVPVIKNADEKSIKGIAREISDYAKKARSGKLTTEDMSGGTFTVNNTGSFGSVQSMGIINYPQAAIIQVESIVKRPVIMNNNMIAIRDMVNLCLSLDHRVLDGLVCGRFLQHVKQLLENICKETTSIY